MCLSPETLRFLTTSGDNLAALVSVAMPTIFESAASIGDKDNDEDDNDDDDPVPLKKGRGWMIFLRLTEMCSHQILWLIMMGEGEWHCHRCLV